MPEQDESASETWILTAGEVDVADALTELQTAFPDLQLRRAPAKAASLTTRQPQRDLSVIDVIVTAIVSKTAQAVLGAAYEKLKALLNAKKGTVKKKPKTKRRK